jgi:hypothetical protein
MAAKPTKTEGKVKVAGADKEFREVRVKKKGHSECRRVGG